MRSVVVVDNDHYLSYTSVKVICLYFTNLFICIQIKTLFLTYKYLQVMLFSSPNNQFRHQSYFDSLDMATSTTFLSFFMCFLVLLHGCVAQFSSLGQSSWQTLRGPGYGRRACRFDRLEALEPSRRVQHEAGITEYYDENNEQLRCAGLSVRRRIINPRGLRLPAYSNTPSLVYIKQGRALYYVRY
jgi:Cupin